MRSGSSGEEAVCGSGGVPLTVAQEEKLRLEAVLRRQLPALQRKYRKLQDVACENRIKYNRCDGQKKMVVQLKEEKRQLLHLLHKMGKKDKSIDEMSRVRSRSPNAVEEIINIYTAQCALVADCHAMLVEISFYVDHIVRTVWKSNHRRRRYLQVPSVEELKRRTERLEGILYHETGRCNFIMADLARAREEMNVYMVERKHFFKRMFSLKSRIERAKQQMYSVVSKANASYNKYDDLRNLEGNLRKRNEAECGAFVNDLKDSVRFLKNDRYIRIFVDLKDKPRIPLVAEGAREKKRIRDEIETLSKIVTRYRRTFKAIGDTIGTYDVDATRQIYIDKEHENFVLFRTITRLENEDDSLQLEIRQLKSQITTTQKHYLDSKNKELARLRKTKETNVERHHKLFELENRWTESKSGMGKLMSEMETLFTTANCDDTGVWMLLGNNRKDGILPRSLMIHLKILENHLHVLKQKKDILEMKKQEESGTKKPPVLSRFLQTITNTRQSHRGGPFRPLIVLTPGMDTGDTDEEERTFNKRPFTYSEFKEIGRDLVDQSTKLIKALTLVTDEDSVLFQTGLAEQPI